jgi:AcrR family transcriptional regulator
VDPRVSRTRAAVLRTATDLLVEGGPYAVTIDAIVARSGVAKSTIYRHWQSRDEVLLAVIESCAPQIPEPDPGTDVVDALREVVHSMVAALNDPEWARVVPALLMLKNHEAGIKAIDERLEHEQDMVVTNLIERAVKEGVLAPGIDVPEAITHLLGPLLFAHLTESVPLDEHFGDRTLDRFLAAYHP